MSQSEEQWVARINALAREMDERASSMHPSAWAEAMRADNERFRRLAGAMVEGERRRRRGG